ncbi:winged helix-turn-helix domain-containing protein [Erwinia tasmaniensis]|uniref:winged helix-turn-helix domain-containing protein n=1 Tax=Erwinia tasmaniensis TaxID=338565 RepID=UPI003A4D45DA
MSAIYYEFGQFRFLNGRLLSKDKGEIALAPKEVSVLLFLLEQANTVISKEDLIREVWKGGTVSDESLTRCIYVLRRALGRTDARRYIETVYGKGYRFLAQVIVKEVQALENRSHSGTPQDDLTKKCSIALFPFKMQRENIAVCLHDQLIEWMQYLKKENNLSIQLVSSCFIESIKSYSNFLVALEKSKADYYIAGTEISYKDQGIIRVELVRAQDHSVVQREAVYLSDDMNIYYQALLSVIMTMISSINPEIASNISIKPTLEPLYQLPA